MIRPLFQRIKFYFCLLQTYSLLIVTKSTCCRGLSIRFIEIFDSFKTVNLVVLFVLVIFSQHFFWFFGFVFLKKFCLKLHQSGLFVAPKKLIFVALSQHHQFFSNLRVVSPSWRFLVNEKIFFLESNFSFGLHTNSRQS